MQNTDERKALLIQWVKSKMIVDNLLPIPGDASFRKYFRIQSRASSYIAVDSPPHLENNLAFIAVASAFSAHGLAVPKILFSDKEKGFLLLSDLGDSLLLNCLTEANADEYYRRAMKNLLKLQSCQDFKNWQLPAYDERLLHLEFLCFQEWYLQKMLGLQLTDSELMLLSEVDSLLIASALGQPQICVHRDFHSRNLMVINRNQLGILDFQDAVKGPLTYDLVSLLRDCYISWPVAKVHDWLAVFYEMLKSESMLRLPSKSLFLQWFDWMGLQRHLKVLGIFSRLYHRDKKDRYLSDIPRVLEYVMQVLNKYPEFSSFQQFMKRNLIAFPSRGEVTIKSIESSG